MSVQWRHFAGVDVENKAFGTAFAPFNEHIPSQNYFDLTLTARIGDHYNFRLGVNNIFDREYTQYLNADPSPGFNAKASLTMKF